MRPQNRIMQPSKKLSIITVCYNAANFIENTIQSVISQTFTNYEFIIIDGNSTDGTVDIIRQYQSYLSYFVSEPDKGIAEAMNKGISQAKGEYLLFLHADDYLFSKESLSKASQQIDSKHDIIAFSIKLKTGHGLYTQHSRNLSTLTNFKTPIWHQGALCKKTLFDTLGVFDTNFMIAMDYDFFLRAYRAGTTMKTSKLILSVMRDGGISSRKDWPGLKVRFEDERDIHKKNCNNATLKLIYIIYWPAYLIYRKIRYTIPNLLTSKY